MTAIPNRKVVRLDDIEPMKWSDVDPARRQVADLERAIRRVTAQTESINRRLTRLEDRGPKR